MKEKFRETIVGPFSGQKYEIRRIRPVLIVRQLGVLPIETLKEVSDQLAAFRDSIAEKVKVDPGLEERTMRFILETGVASPKIWFGEESECPDEQLCFADMGGDIDAVAKAIMDYSFDFRGLRDMEKFFRGAGAGDPGLAGSTVREEAVGVSADGVQADAAGV